MTTLSRIKTVPAYDTIPAPPPSSSRRPSHPDDEPAPHSRLVDSARRRDTLPAPPPDHDEVEEPIPSTERTLPDAS